ncbi:Galactose-binding protein regulator (plasmid) [Variovorax sp. PBL-E5]|nr:Galactose-binding protein regulator [Variovorax sp. PBL-E5]
MGDRVNDIFKAFGDIKNQMVQIKQASQQRAVQRRHLEAIVAIDDGKSVHGAARALGLAQPAVSRLLSEAEKALGERVFERSSRGSHPTAWGERVLAQARAVLRSLERLDLSAGLDRGPVSLGCIARAMHTLMPNLLERVARDGEASGPVRLQLIEESSTFLWDAVSRGTLDFAILRGRSDTAGDDELLTERLYDERTVIICAPDAGPQGKSVLSRAELMRQRWVLPDARTSSREAFDRYCSDGRLGPIHPVIETRSFETGLALAARTGFLSIAPESIARRHEALGLVRVLRTRVPLPTSPTVLVFKRWAVEDPVLAGLRTQIHAAAAAARHALRGR